MQPQPDDPRRATKFLTDGGMGTTFIYREGIDLPLFASFTLMSQVEGRDQIRRYFRPYLDLARHHGVGFVLETPTWRANADWGERLGYSPEALAQVNRDAVLLGAGLQAEYAEDVPVILSGTVGPRGDGYQGSRMTADGSRAYHSRQVETFAEAGADRITCLTMTTTAEATGIALAALEAEMPSVISFTVETNGRLPGGATIGEAIEQIDNETGGAPLYYMINCAHPSHFESELERGAPWLSRIGGIRANASAKSHVELDESTVLDDGDPVDLSQRYHRLMTVLPNLQTFGGCCGTDYRHVAAIAETCLGPHTH